MKQPAPRRTAHARPGQEPHQLIERDGSLTWLTRAAGFLTAITQVQAGSVLVRADNQGESMLILPPGQKAVIKCGNQSQLAEGESLSILPPGPCEITLSESGWIYRLYGAIESDLAERAANAELYRDPETGQTLPPPVAWPEPYDGWKIRYYKLNDYVPTSDELIMPRVFRCTNLMVNAFVPFRAPRPVKAMRPHWHDDFDQASVTISGTWVHYARTPWGSDMTQWRADESFEVDSPSTAIFPAQVIHTSRNLTCDAWMLDVFGPPRLDLSSAGLVLNGDEYPLPEQAQPVSNRDVPSAWTAKR